MHCIQLHEQDELYSIWGPDPPVIPPQTALFQFALVAFGFVSFGLFAKNVLLPEIPVVRREYPYSGLVTELGSLEENKVCLISMMGGLLSPLS